MHALTNEIIGGNLRRIRRAAGLSQMDLAVHLGISYQQIQKYEAGQNRISAASLWQISGILDVPHQHFFDGLARPERVPEATNLHALIDACSQAAPEVRDALVTILSKGK